MKVTETPIQGLHIFEPAVYKDDRGLFYESWREQEYRDYGIQETFLQDNISVSYKNVLRGLHYQKNQGQLVSVIQGHIFDVAVDMRPHSPTFKKYFSLELSSDNPQQLYMTPGFAHGFYVLSDKVVMSYKCTQYYNSACESGIIWNDPELAIKWPLAGNPIISKKDSLFIPISLNVFFKDSLRNTSISYE